MQERRVWIPSDGVYTDNINQIKARKQSESDKSVKPKVSVWPSKYEYLSSTWSFTLSLHSVWSLPLSVLQYGGAAYLTVYITVLAIVGAPLLLLEMFLGQYSSLAPVQVYTHLCPLVAGLGLTTCIQAGVRAMLDTAVIMWSGQALWHLFSSEEIRDGFFYRDVLAKEDATLEHLGDLVAQLSLVLGVCCVTIFILSAAGIRSVGKICVMVVPACYLLLVVMVVRSCMCTGGLGGIMTLLTPDWSVMTSTSVWLEATAQVIFSLQLGTGAVTAYSSYNTYHHNIVRDCYTIIIFHLLWVILLILLTFSLLGVAHSTQTINLTNLAQDPAILSITGQNVWLVAITLIETSLSTINYGWFWAGIFFIIIILVSISSVFGYIEILLSSVISYRPNILHLKPSLTFIILTIMFLLDLVLATQGGVHIYHLLLIYIYNWPSLLLSLFTVLTMVLCHGVSNVIQNISDICKVMLPHWFSSHLSVIYFSILPTFLMVSCIIDRYLVLLKNIQASLVHNLEVLSSYHLLEPLSTFGLLLPEWGMPMGWSLAFLPLSPLLFWALVHSIWGNRGVHRLTVSIVI